MKQLTIGNVEAIFRDVALDIGLVISEFTITSSAARIDVDPFAMELSSPGVLQAIVSEQSIANFLAKKAPGGLRDVVVKANGGKIHLNGKVQIVVNIGIDATATLEIVNGKELHVKLLTLDALGGAAKNLVEGQLAQINPIINANDFPFDVQFTRVEIENGQIHLFGQVLRV